MREAFVWALPVYALVIAIELASTLRHPGRYERRDTFANLGVSLGNTLAGLAWGPFVFALYWLGHLATPLRIPTETWTLVVLFVLSDFCYYASHRCGHRVSFFWATHQVHHTSRHLNFTVGLRNPWTSGLHDWVFWMPLPLLGFDPVALVKVQTIGLIFQFFLHTELVGSLGPIGWVFNTPSHHRVHHGTNPQYLDKNFGGVLIIWDRMFGTFEPERAKPIYGSIKPLDSSNPFVIATRGWRDLFISVARNRSGCWARLLGPPVIILFLAATSSPARADERRNAVRADVGMFSAVGFVGATYSRAVQRWLVVETGVGLGLTGVQLSAGPRVSLGTGRNRFVAGGGFALAIPTVRGHLGDPGYLRDSPGVFLDLDLAGYEVVSPDNGLTFLAAMGVTTLVYSPGDPGLVGTPYPQLHVGVGRWF